MPRHVIKVSKIQEADDDLHDNKRIRMQGDETPFIMSTGMCSRERSFMT